MGFREMCKHVLVITSRPTQHTCVHTYGEGNSLAVEGRRVSFTSNSEVMHMASCHRLACFSVQMVIPFSNIIYGHCPPHRHCCCCYYCYWGAGRVLSEIVHPLSTVVVTTRTAVWLRGLLEAVSAPHHSTQPQPQPQQQCTHTSTSRLTD
ncbi:hypothetical protein LSM04_009187 [Trypanosoma melophagium]|uniref:uncharacterized protein n=1 Tax=Trypanosoma melophagium TaxID=715481 RepID=UPI00351A4B18|nr:hypothetical protein LSM04_003098 [Trypanosoma melophagium]KAH9588753.1 hypothetical protein LSM04_004659 [Trypanosoma melophagium]KAH9588793.1 hypothetical protein LSM04_007831 [Trypanosoma melophagium]KAH9588807.1 hypothetical protein LSM04_009187 [Trypanosoma melophagium]